MIEGPRIAGVVLAAGRSSRMKRDKALIRVDGEAIVHRLVRVYREAGLDRVIVVGRKVRGAESAPGGTEMIDSLANAIERLPPVIAAAVVQPVDAPFTTVEIIHALVGRGAGEAVVPFHRGSPGHPVLVPRALFEAICARPAGGLRTLLASAQRIETNDDRILADLDAPEDLARFGVIDE